MTTATAKIYILSLGDVSIDQTHWHTSLRQAERYFRKKWKWDDALTITEFD